MRKFLRSTLTFLLVLALAAPLSLFAAASEALGEDVTSRDTTVNNATVLSTDVFWSTSYSDLRTENLITYTPNTSVTPIVTYGGTVTSCNTVSATAKALESQGYRVVAGLNGDFFNFSTGLPTGLLIANGEIKSSDAGYYAIGFKADGTAVLGKPALTINADLGYTSYDADGYATAVTRTLAGVNKARVSTGGIYLYTYDFNDRHTTGNTEAGVDVVCTVTGGSLSIGGALTLQVQRVVEATSATAIAQGEVVLSANNQSNSYYTAALKNEAAGNTITITATPADQNWNGVQYAVGSLYSLVQNSTVVSGLPTGLNPRTAVGQKADGTLVFYTIDGRQSGLSIGASLSQVGERLVELGCVTALCLDGGGSTTLTVTQPSATAAKTINSPSGGSERSVSNHIFLVASNSPTGVLDHYYVSSDSAYALAGSKVNITAAAVDTNYIPMADSGYSLSASAGSLSGSVLTTPAEGGDVTVTASDTAGHSGSAVIHAIKTPDDVAIKNGTTAIKTLNVAPGTVTTLTPSAAYHHASLKADAAAFTWSVTGNVGTVSADGKFTATTPGSGTITATAGGVSATLTVKVGAVALSTVESFENGAPAIDGSNTALSANTALDTVRMGRASGQLTYTLGADGTASLDFVTPYAISAAYTCLNLWVYGDGSGTTLSVLTSDGSTVTATAAAVLDFTGWKQVTAVLPAGTTALTGLRIAGAAAADGTYPAAGGTVYLDQIVASYGSVVDTAVPAITASLSGTALSASVSDAADGIPAKSAVAVTLDGKAAAFTYDESTGKLTAALAISDTNGHRVTVTARDASGNIGRASCDIAAASGATLFTDTAGYWAASYVDWLKTAGITTGYSDGTFRPNQKINRQEFAVMLYRYLGIDGTKYESAELPFADAAKIGSFAQTAVKALYALGIVGGTQKDGALYFNPAGSLTRAQAAAMIGRTQEKGYAVGALSFTDAAAIPAYAQFYIETMSAQGVIGGYADGTFGPSANITRGQMAKILYNLL